MALTKEHLELLDRWREGALSDADQELLRIESANNDDLRAEMDVYELLEDGFQALELEAFEQQLTNWEVKHQPQQTPVIPIQSYSSTQKFLVSMKKYWAAAALILALLPLGYWLYSGAAGSATPESLFADNFKAEDISPQVVLNRGTGSPDLNEDGSEVVPDAADLEESRLKALLSNGVNAYNKKSYTEAISYFEEYLKSPEKITNSREIRFYVGVSYLAQNQTAQAKEIFKDLSQQPMSAKLETFIQSSQWYLALTLLKEGETQQAKKRLMKIANEGAKHPYKKQATEMLAKMDQYQVD